ncbi:ABC transporter permease [Hydrogenibacillus schlegelii]|uniref:ABC transporter permease n=1 Tax=Hydrogenibacillus schlegelii TaxID=1484 RepID=A0A132MFV5_HYDSH|nr:ABC transporter permease [Hydrogenibacillus schlegelii]KWW96712.1 ABC transporter permease [Hydrogenibacillus schlegelii]OAR05337.1 ABC transporter permease [Hydrogenibacillus schlegelii]PTQ52314.1 MAG: ABC transporter permease protein [Hydrogenibacillus schlegelii]
MAAALIGAVEAGLIFGVMALGVYLSFRVLNFPDLTVDGSFVTGAALASILVVYGVSPWTANLAAFVAGATAGLITGVLHAWGKINPLLSGILMMIALYSINLRIMGRPNIPLLHQRTMWTDLAPWTERLQTVVPGADHLIVLFVLGLMVLAMKLILDWFLKTEIGLAVRATGDSPRMVRSFSGDTRRFIVLGLAVSNAYVAFAGALMAQYGGFADIGMGIGMIVVGLASVIIGETLFRQTSLHRLTAAVIAGAVLYRIIIALALRARFLETGDVKLITALIVILALVLPEWRGGRKMTKAKPASRILRPLPSEGGEVGASPGGRLQDL